MIDVILMMSVLACTKFSTPYTEASSDVSPGNRVVFDWSLYVYKQNNIQLA